MIVKKVINLTCLNYKYSDEELEGELNAKTNLFLFESVGIVD